MPLHREVPEYREYARIHQKIDVQARMVAINERLIYGVKITTKGLKSKVRTALEITENMESLTRWAGRKNRTKAEKYVARTSWLQWRELLAIVKGHIEYITAVTEAIKDDRLL